MAKKKIQSPEILLSLFKEYQQYTKANPVKVKKWVGWRKPREVIQPKERPLTYTGFECYVMSKGIISTLDHYFMNYQDRYKDFVNVCRRIKTAIRADQIEGGMVGIYNPAITARITGLKDKKETENRGTVTVKVTRKQ